jgi:hypothetical protein
MVDYQLTTKLLIILLLRVGYLVFFCEKAYQFYCIQNKID